MAFAFLSGDSIPLSFLRHPSEKSRNVPTADDFANAKAYPSTNENGTTADHRAQHEDPFHKATLELGEGLNELVARLRKRLATVDDVVAKSVLSRLVVSTEQEILLDIQRQRDIMQSMKRMREFAMLSAEQQKGKVGFQATGGRGEAEVLDVNDRDEVESVGKGDEPEFKTPAELEGQDELEDQDGDEEDEEEDAEDEEEDEDEDEEVEDDDKGDCISTVPPSELAQLPYGAAYHPQAAAAHYNPYAPYVATPATAHQAAAAPQSALPGARPAVRIIGPDGKDVPVKPEIKNINGVPTAVYNFNSAAAVPATAAPAQAVHPAYATPYTTPYYGYPQGYYRMPLEGYYQ